MKDVLLKWTLPVEREDGAVLPADQIKHSLLYGSVAPETTGWTLINTVVAPANELLVPELEEGPWHFQCVIVDDTDQQSDPVVTDIDLSPVQSSAKPKPATGFTAEVVP